MKPPTFKNHFKYSLSLIGLVVFITSFLYLPLFNSIPQLSQFIPEIKKAEAWYSNDYQNRREVILDGTKIATTTTSFPIMVSTTLADLRTTAYGGNVQDDYGYDIIWVDSNDIALLNFEIEKYVDSTGEIVHWVETSIETSTSKTIYMYYNNDEIIDSQENVTGVWDDDFVMVQHMNEDPGPGGAGDIVDSTQYGNNGTAGASMISDDQVAGQINGSLDFDGDDDYVVIANATSMNVSDNLTISVWFSTDTITGGNIRLIDCGEGGAGYYVAIENDVARYRAQIDDNWYGGVEQLLM